MQVESIINNETVLKEEILSKSTERKAIFYLLMPVFLASILAYMDRVNISFAALHVNEDLGFSATVYGMGAGIFFAGYVLFEVPGAIFAEKWSPSKWIARILFTWGLVCLLMAFMQNEWHFYILRFLLGACEASFYPVVYASIIPRWFVADARARVTSLMLTSLVISSIIGAPLAGWVLDIHAFGYKGWQILFFVEGLITCLYGFVFLFGIKDNPVDVKWLTTEEKAYLLNSLKKEEEKKVKKQEYTVWQAMTDKKVLYLCAIYFFWITGYWGFNFWMPQVLKAATGWSASQIGLATVVPMTFSLIVMIMLGRSASARNEHYFHVGIPLLIASIGFFIGAMFTHPVVACLSVIIVAIGVFPPLGTWWAIPTTFLSGAAAAGAIGLIHSVGNIGGFVGPYIVGIIKDMTGSHVYSYYYLASSLLVASILVIRIRKSANTQ